MKRWIGLLNWFAKQLERGSATLNSASQSLTKFVLHHRQQELQRQELRHQELQRQAVQFQGSQFVRRSKFKDYLRGCANSLRSLAPDYFGAPVYEFSGLIKSDLTFDQTKFRFSENLKHFFTTPFLAPGMTVILVAVLIVSSSGVLQGVNQAQGDENLTITETGASATVNWSLTPQARAKLSGSLIEAVTPSPSPNSGTGSDEVGDITQIPTATDSVINNPTSDFVTPNSSGDISSSDPTVAAQLPNPSLLDIDALRIELAGIFKNAQYYSVKLIDLSGTYADFNLNDQTDVYAASTYKIYYAYSMLKAIENGRNRDAMFYKDWTLGACLTKMIVESNNECADEWTKNYAQVREDLRDLGVSNLTGARTDGFHTTASDLAVVLQKLYRGEILNAAHRDELIGLMRSQIYRAGIPSGIGEADVADKVGFWDGVLNDAGLVYSPKGDYVLVILTGGASWTQIAQAASTIYDYL
jgi:beta-lactamase class A